MFDREKRGKKEKEIKFQDDGLVICIIQRDLFKSTHKFYILLASLIYVVRLSTLNFFSLFIFKAHVAFFPPISKFENLYFKNKYATSCLIFNLIQSK